MSAEQNITASLVYPLVTKLVTHDLAECADDSPTIANFKHDLCAALDDCFALSKADIASHLFVMATVLDLATKQCKLFPESLHFAAYDHVCALMLEAPASLPAETDDRDADESGCASQACQDGQPVSIVVVTGSRCCYPGSDDRLITDYHVTMIGYR